MIVLVFEIWKSNTSEQGIYDQTNSGKIKKNELT